MHSEMAVNNEEADGATLGTVTAKYNELQDESKADTDPLVQHEETTSAHGDLSPDEGSDCTKVALNPLDKDSDVDEAENAPPNCGLQSCKCKRIVYRPSSLIPSTHSADTALIQPEPQSSVRDESNQLKMPENAESEGTADSDSNWRRRIGLFFNRCLDLLDIPLALVFGIVLYVVDVGSDIAAGVTHIREGHLLWGSLTITFVILPAVGWAAISCTWWYLYRLNSKKRTSPNTTEEEHNKTRRIRMLLSVLLLDQLTRQIRVLWFTCRREYCKFRGAGWSSSENISEDDRKRRRPEHWQRKLNQEHSNSTLRTAIATLVEDAPEIVLVIYSIARGIQPQILDYVQLASSLTDIFYTTATFPQQLRSQMREEIHIKTFSMTTVVLIVWRTLIVGSRIMIFVLFALSFRYWLFVVIGVHYLLMFALVFYQMWLTKRNFIRRVVYNVVVPLVYIFDFCVNLINGPTFYWYLMCYVPMYCQNVLMSWLVLWYASTMPSPAWYTAPGCVGVIFMLPLGVLVQLAYYRHWHPNVLKRKQSQPDYNEPVQIMSWSTFRDAVRKANGLQ